MLDEVLHGFRLTLKLGESGMGDVYQAVHRESRQKATVSLLPAGLSADPARLAGCFAEVKAAGQVGHPGIPVLLACGVHASGQAFLILEHIAGTSLAAALRELGRVSDMESLADMGCQLATLLDAAHSAGVVHGALGPASVFLTFPSEPSGRPLLKLLDFGMACLGSTAPAGRGLGRFDRRVDMYALGCLLFEMACGQPPFARGDSTELPAPAALQTAVPPGLAVLIDRMLSKSPDAPQSMAEVAKVLESFCRSPVPTLVAPPSDPPLHHAQAPTALLPPASSPPPARPPTWVGRARQSTAILDPPEPASRPPRPAPRPAINVRIVVLTATLVIGAGAALLLLRSKRPPPSTLENTSPVSTPRVPASEEDVPSPPLADPPAPPQQPAAAPEVLDEAAVPSTSAGRAREKRRSARRW
jgi:serine/threonine-protein kinase